MVAYPMNTSGSDRVLLVEGQDDKHMVWQLCKRDDSSFSATRSGYCMRVTLRGQSTTFLISDKVNRDKLIKSINLEMNVSGRQTVGILVDAADDLGECWDKVVKEISRTGIQLPSSPDPVGTIIPGQDYQPRIGIWLMPDNKSQGELEDFALKMIPSSDTVWPLSQGYVDNIPESDRKVTPEKADKAKLYAWLATRKEPARMGAAVGAEDLEVNGPLCQNFFAWLTKLFG